MCTCWLSTTSACRTSKYGAYALQLELTYIYSSVNASYIKQVKLIRLELVKILFAPGGKHAYCLNCTGNDLKSSPIPNKSRTVTMHPRGPLACALKQYITSHDTHRLSCPAQAGLHHCMRITGIISCIETFSASDRLACCQNPQSSHLQAFCAPAHDLVCRYVNCSHCNTGWI